MQRELKSIISRAEEQLAAQNIHGAIEYYQQALTIRPNDSGILYSLGMAHYKASNINAASGYFQRSLENNSKSPAANYGVGLVKQAQGDLDEAIIYFKKAIKLKPTVALFHIMLAGAYQELGDGEQAHAQLQHAVKLEPRNIQAQCLLATSFEQMHQLEQAADVVNQVLSLQPGYQHASLILARLKRRKNQLTEAAEILENLIGKDINSQLLYRVYYELGRVRNKQKEYDAAFNAFDRANKIQLTLPEAQGFDIEVYYTIINQYKQIKQEQFTSWRSENSFKDDLQPVFLVGFPRSGTTMTEQIMASHPEITSADEKPLLANCINIAWQQSSHTSVSDVLEGLTSQQIKNIRNHYYESLQPLKSSSTQTIVVDKLPLNIIALGFINRVFPDAKVIVALRDPRDVCLSCFMQEFSPNAGMLNFNTLENTVRFYQAVMSLWVHQREILSLDIIELRYEDTIADLEQQARRLLTFLEKDWDPCVLNFYKNDNYRSVTTPSYEAISEPVNPKAIARWKHYKAHLSPVLDKLPPLLTALGYTN